ncbi:MAG: RagB/SusD family nutrient uptake outer membrane protein [Chitinophagaceae bacterium]|nr:RagB/SusD family nutrient uptake outer membrane protein [Chitinophagaceae bacterium]
MKKVIKYSLGFLLLTAISTSCKKSLNIPNPNATDESNFWKTGTDALAGINAVYGINYRQGTYARSIFWDNPRSDDGWASTGYPPLATIINFTQTDYNFDQTANLWYNNYQGIYRANQVIINVPGITMDETLKKRYVAEAKFLRAIFYYNLVTHFGHIPLILTKQNTTDLPSQETPENVYLQIEKDLTEAAADLPASYPNADVGRVTKGAAFAQLGKAYLQQHKNQQAADALSWLVTGPGATNYSLVANFGDNFIETTENNRESVFEVQFNGRSSVTDIDDPRSNLGNQRGPFKAPPGPLRFNDAQMRRWVIGEFEIEKTVDGKRDPRLFYTAFFDSTDVRGPDFSIIYGRTFNEQYGPGDPHHNEVWYRKYADDTRPNHDETFEGPINLRVIRYADVLLMYAEALNNLGQTTTAYQYVDRVRQRAGLARLTDAKPNLSQGAFLQQLMHERITELTGEDVRWNDLARWGYFDDQAKINELKSRDVEFNNFKIGKNNYLPIPQSETDINPNLKQNPFY